MRRLLSAWAFGSVCALSSLLFATSASAHDKHCKEYSGTFTSAAVPGCEDSLVGLCTVGVLQGDLVGEYYFVFDSLGTMEGDDSKQVYTGTSVITTDDGVLYTEDSGVLDAMPEGEPESELPADLVTTAAVVGGTKKFTMLAGEFVASGTLISGIAEGTYRATLCKQHGHDQHDHDHP